MDIISSIEHIDLNNYLNVQYTVPFTSYYEQYGFQDMIFCNNSGPLISISILMMLNYIIWKIIHYLSIKLYRFRICRKLGMQAESNLVLKTPYIALVLEGFIDINISTFLQLWKMSQSPTLFDFYLTWFFTVDNIFNSIFTILFTLLLFIVTIYGTIGLHNNYKDLQQENIKENYGYFYQDLHCKNRLSANYTLISLFRRFLVIIILLFLVEWPGI